MSNIDKQVLREEFRFMQVHYSDPADRARQVIYIAAEALLDELESKQTFQQAFFRQSIMYDVVAEAYEEAKEQIAKDVEIKARLCRESNSLHDRLRAAERSIAELEAKLETADKLQDSAFRDGLKAGFSYGQTDDQSGFAQCMSAYSTRAGIGVKQQKDSVDSDVGGRNQPGMVPAIYIGAGDFVKIKGQVFEVEETDFDDHDVTLWFVGGNALKCSAGCPVEVVSAPVAAGIKVKGE